MTSQKNPFTSPATAEELDRPLDFRVASQMPDWDLLPPRQQALVRRQQVDDAARVQRNEAPVTASAVLAQKICGSCSSPLDEEAQFCSECGAGQGGGAA